MATKFIDEKGFTTRSWEDYRKEAKKIWNNIPYGEDKKKVVEEALGKGLWPDKKGNMVQWELNSNPRSNDGFQRKTVKTRAKNQRQTRKNRIENEKFTDITSEDASAEWKRKNIEDWNNGGNPTGEKLVKGTDDYNQFFRRYEHKIKVGDDFWKGDTGLDYLSGDPENLTYSYKHQWNLKDAGEMSHGKDFIFDIDDVTGEVSYTPRKNFNPGTAKYKPFTNHVDETLQAARKGSKFVKGAKLVGRAVPWVSLGLAGTGFIDQASATTQDASVANYAKLGLRTVDLGLEVVDAFTMGLSTPVTLAAQAGLMAVEDYIDNGPAKISTIGRTRR